MALTTGLVPLFGLPTEWRQGGKITRAGARVWVAEVEPSIKFYEEY